MSDGNSRYWILSSSSHHPHFQHFHPSNIIWQHLSAQPIGLTRLRTARVSRRMLAHTSSLVLYHGALAVADDNQAAITVPAKSPAPTILPPELWAEVFSYLRQPLPQPRSGAGQDYRQADLARVMHVCPVGHSSAVQCTMQYGAVADAHQR